MGGERGGWLISLIDHDRLHLGPAEAAGFFSGIGGGCHLPVFGYRTVVIAFTGGIMV